MTQSRMTRQKQLILDIALAHHDHPTADQIYAEVRAIDGRISRGTVYRDLEQLSAAGILLHVKVPGADRFDCRLDRHYHLICKHCGGDGDDPRLAVSRRDQPHGVALGLRPALRPAAVAYRIDTVQE